METLTTKEFIEQLKTNSLKLPLVIKGIVKKSESDAEVLYARKGDFSNWLKIPATMIESVRLLKSFTKEDNTFAVVKLKLKAPANAEGKVLYDLLSLTEKSCLKEKPMHKPGCTIGGEGHFCPHCGCHKGHDHNGCGCGCHKAPDGGCGCHEEHHGEFECGSKKNWEKQC
ncbi:MAG: hypothetical protein ACLQQ4_13735 [Bacteroidia bacterium]